MILKPFSAIFLAMSIIMSIFVGRLINKTDEEDIIHGVGTAGCSDCGR